jgi:dipeptidyl aminopeptidase/acylaminoacyl peptidase
MSDFDSGSGMLVGKPHQVTEISAGADGGIWPPDGKNIVFVSAVYPDCKDDACNKQRDEGLKKGKVKAKIFTRLFYRHWNAFTEFKRSHLFVIPADATVEAGVSPAPTETVVAGVSPAESQPARLPLQKNANAPRDLTPGDHDVPPFSLGGQDMYTISPDSQEVAYTSNIESEAGPAFIEATSTNNEIFVVPIAGGTPKKISTSPGADTTPLYSADGKYLAWRSQARAGFEADKWRLLVQDRQTGKIDDVTNTSGAAESFDVSIGSYTWTSDSTQIIAATENRGGTLFCWFSPRVTSEKVARNCGGDFHGDDLVCQDHRCWYSKARATSPNEIWKIDLQKDPHDPLSPVTHMNDGLLLQIDMQPLESFTFKGANDDNVQGFMVKPPGFIPNKKYPLKFLIHGGPQGAWETNGHIAGTRSCSRRPEIMSW